MAHFIRRAVTAGLERRDRERRSARRALRCVRREVRAGDAHDAASRAGGGLARGALQSALHQRSAAATRLVRRTADAAVPRRQPGREDRRRRAALPQARGPDPHRRPQDQQLQSDRRSGQADGEIAAGGGNRRRAARRRHRDVAALLGFRCTVYMGEEDMRRQALNVFRMRLLGAEVTAVTAAAARSRRRSARRCATGVTNVSDTHYVLGSVLGPHPYPTLVRDLQAGHRARGTAADPRGRRSHAGRARRLRRRREQLDRAVPRLSRGSRGADVRGRGGRLGIGRRAAPARFAGGSPGVLHGTRTFILRRRRQRGPTHRSRRARLRRIGPEHAPFTMPDG